MTNKYLIFYIFRTNQKIRKTFIKRNMFEFNHIKPFDRGYIDNPGAMVVFATPGMLHAGLSLQIFKKWAPNENNMLIMPGELERASQHCLQCLILQYLSRLLRPRYRRSQSFRRSKENRVRESTGCRSQNGN